MSDHSNGTTLDNARAEKTATYDVEKEAGQRIPPLSPSSPTMGGARSPKIERQKSTLSRTLSRADQLSLSRSLSRQTSAPFGGTAAVGVDWDLGLAPVKSREDEEARFAEREVAEADPFSVKFEPGEKINPKNWSYGFRWYLTLLGSGLVLNSTFASSIPSGITEPVMEHFRIGTEVGILCISLFVTGYCVGPLLWGPLSEIYGRRPIFILTFFCYTCFQVGCALSPNIGALLAFRFLGGIFASAPLTNSGALLADIWDNDTRGKAMGLFSLAPFAGPSLGPIISGFIAVTHTNWRWVYWILTMFAGVCFVLIIFTVPETYGPKILVNKAKKLRKETGDDRYYAPLERHSHSFKSRVNDTVVKPFQILFNEPMLLAITLYMSFTYGIIYLLFEAYPFVFVRNHGFNAGENGLAFLGFFTGGVLATAMYMLYFQPRYEKYAHAIAPAMPEPEKRLELSVLSSWIFVVSMFWFGWTSYSSIHWISPVMAGGLLGMGVLGLFVSLFNYIVDTYLWVAASALASSTVIRALFGAGFPLFANQMYEKLGTQWASSLCGFLALAMTPIPLLLIKYGAALRAKSKFSPEI